MTRILPYSDSSMTYDNSLKRYVLTLDEVRNRLGVDLPALVDSPYVTDHNIAAQRILDQVSSAIYLYIYSYNPDNLFQRYLLHCIPESRALIKEAMLNQVEYIIRNGDINQYTWINSSSMHKIEDVRNDRATSPYSIQVLMRPLDSKGTKLLFSGRYAYDRNLVSNSEEW